MSEKQVRFYPGEATLWHPTQASIGKGTSQKFCKDCRWFGPVAPSGVWKGDHICGYSMTKQYNPVTGEEYWTDPVACFAERYWDGENHCGPEAKFWEAKE